MHNLADINQTYIIETINSTGSTSACTTVYTTAITNCSGNTTIYLNNGLITFDGSIYTNNNVSANTINASTFISGGTNIIDLFNSKSLTGGTFNNSTDTLTLKNNDNSTIVVTGFTDYYTTGTTVIGNTIYFNRNDQLSAYTVNLPETSIDVFSTGLTFSNNQLIITRNDGNSFNTFINTFSGLTINGLLISNTISANTISATTYYGDGSNLTGVNSTIITGGTPNNSDKTYTFTNNTGGTFVINGLTDININNGNYNNGTLTLFNNTGGTVIISGFSTGNSNSDVYVTGGTYNNGTIIFVNNTGGTFNINGFYTGYTAPIDIYVTGATVNNSTKQYTFKNNTGGTFVLDGLTDININNGNFSNGVLTLNNSTGGTVVISGFSTGTSSSDIYVTGGTPNNSTKQYTFVNNTGGTFTLNGLTDITITSGTYSLGSLTLNDTTGGTISITGFSTGNSNSDVYVTGGTYSNGSVIFRNNTGGTFTVTGFSTGSSSNIISGTTNQINVSSSSGVTTLSLPSNLHIANSMFIGGTSSLQFGDNGIGGSITGFIGGVSDGVFRFGDSSGGGSPRIILGSVSSTLGVALKRNGAGLQIRVGDDSSYGSLSAQTISATTYLNLPTDIFITGGTPNNSTKQYTFVNNTGGTFSISGLTDLYITGGTYSNGTLILVNNTGGTITLTGFSTGTSSSDIYVTGGTPNNSTKQYTFVNNTGGTFNVVGLSDVYVTGGTYSNGSVIFRNNTGGTFTVNNFYTGSTDITITGGTYNTSILSLTNNTGGTLIITGFTDYYTTGATLTNGIIYFNRNDQLSAYTVSLSSFTSNATVITGVTFSDNNLYLLNSTGGTYSTLIDNFSGLTVTGFSNTGTTRIVESSSGGTLSASKEIIDTFISDINLIAQLQNSNNWFGSGSAVALNAPTGTTTGYQGQWYVGGISGIPYLFFCKTDGIWIRESLTDTKLLQEGGTGANLSGTTASGIITMNATGTSLTNSGLFINQSLRTTDSPTFVNITATLLQLSSLLRLTPGTPTTITGTTNNWSTGSASAIQRISSSSANTITGLLAGSNGDLRFFTNVGSFNMTFTHEDTGSTAANRFSFSNNSNIILNTGCSFTIYYDTTTARWRDLCYNAASNASNKFLPARTPVNDTNYTVLSTDYLIAYTNLTAGRTMTLPSASGNTFKTYVAKDESGSAATFNITISGGTNTIDGATTKIINSNYGSFEIYSNGVNYFTK